MCQSPESHMETTFRHYTKYDILSLELHKVVSLYFISYILLMHVELVVWTLYNVNNCTW